MAKLAEWLLRFYSAWNQSNDILAKEGEEAYQKLDMILKSLVDLEERPFSEKELKRIFSVATYWNEILEREEFPEIVFSAELNQLVRHAGATRILIAVLASAKIQKIL